MPSSCCVRPTPPLPSRHTSRARPGASTRRWDDTSTSIYSGRITASVSKRRAGALHIDTDIRKLEALWHPQVSNKYKARVMNGLMSPASPEAYRKETSQVYASGWPPAFLGDLHYYMVEYDLREEASAIDTAKIGVHILSGEYDSSGTMELGQEAHTAIAGSTWTGMQDIGHFPMSENPEKFIEYLLPVLEKIQADNGG